MKVLFYENLPSDIVFKDPLTGETTVIMPEFITIRSSRRTDRVVVTGWLVGDEYDTSTDMQVNVTFQLVDSVIIPSYLHPPAERFVSKILTALKVVILPKERRIE